MDQAGCGARQRPPNHRNRQSEPRPHDVEKNSADKPRACVGNLKRPEDVRKLAKAEMKFMRDDGSQNRERLPVDVVDRSRAEERPDDPPAAPVAYCAYNSVRALV